MGWAMRILVECSACGQKNRVDTGRIPYGKTPVCGKCKTALPHASNGGGRPDRKAENKNSEYGRSFLIVSIAIIGALVLFEIVKKGNKSDTIEDSASAPVRVDSWFDSDRGRIVGQCKGSNNLLPEQMMSNLRKEKGAVCECIYNQYDSIEKSNYREFMKRALLKALEKDRKDFVSGVEPTDPEIGGPEGYLIFMSSLSLITAKCLFGLK